VLVYRFGLRPPTDAAELVRAQLRLAWEYRRDLQLGPLVRKRQALRALQSQVASEETAYRQASIQLDELLLQMRKQRQATRSRSEDVGLREAVKEARKLRTEARRALAVARRAQKDQNAADLVNEVWLRERRELRAQYSERGLRHGTYSMVEQSVEAANSSTPLWDGLEPQDPRVPRWDGTGRIGVQVQGGIPVKAFWASQGTMVKLRSEPDRFQERALDGRGGGKHRAVFAQLSLRVGSNPDRTPVWAGWPVKVHRPMPEQGIIKYVVVSLRRCGPHEQWTTEITVDEQGAQREHCGVGTVAVDLGWRDLGDTQRAAYWRDDQGDSGELILSAGLISALRYPETLRSIRDQNLNKMIPEFLAGLPEELPDWLRARTVKRDEELPSSAQARAWLTQWRSQKRWASLAQVKDWGETGCPDVLYLWWQQDRHLWEWESHQRQKALNRRQHEFRVWCCGLTRRYGTIVIEADRKGKKAFDLRPLVVQPNPEAPAENQRARSNRHMEAPGELRLDLVNAAKARGCELVWEPCRDTTRECPFDDCRQVETWDAAKSIEKQPPCSKCGRVWDQDDGACRVLLRRYRERPVGNESTGVSSEPETAVIIETRQTKMRRLRAEKLARMEAARKPVDMVAESGA
jgi:hypothetical protein